MKTVTILSSAVAILAATSAYASSMPQTHEPGAPTKQGKYCWTSTNEYGAGWWHRCGDLQQIRGRGRGRVTIVTPKDPPPPPPPTIASLAGEDDGSGDGGGGGGGGGDGGR
jgi:hypothetical protein